ncbi:OPT oligopeptide transporter protein-domain-containing protein [Lactarius akahatsu]|uniref:OPT oligopeptide transporter protein-domain-containing protein n=1 Tax=Lactarius akahatsu TaxID=416441 RepID=A0AAD4LF04_9AGAM|nr:OPT oligopeptide transporter protein-domain-containing protein [Lactarius akahatsu]
MAGLQEFLPCFPSSSEPTSKEKTTCAGAAVDKKESVVLDEDEMPLYVNGEPVITSGKDVSKYLVDLRDDEDPPFTLRSIVLGTIIGGLGATLYQIYIFKPIQAGISAVFLQLIIYSLGILWSAFLPRKSWVEGTRLEWLGLALHFVNPGEFKLKEHVTASVVASSASWGTTAVLNFAVERLYYDTGVRPSNAILSTFSTAVFGYGMVGLLRPVTIYPSEMVYWGNLPTVSIFQALHFDNTPNHKRVRLFWTAFSAMFVYEIFPSYIFPLLNGFSIFCMASQHTSPRVQNIFTNIFGGAEGNEGLGLFNLSFDWQYIGSGYMSLPLIQQANSWIGYFLCYIAIAAIYYSDMWNSKSFPMLSTSLFSSNGSIYHQTSVFTGPNFQLNQTALGEVGLPALTGSNAWAGLMGSLAIGSLIAHCIFFWGPSVVSSFKHARDKTQPDPHWVAMQKYDEAPWWWYILLLLSAFFAGLISVLKGQTTLPVWSYIVALISGAIVAPFSTLLFARMGNGITTTQLFKMIAGAINPGRPVANLYFSMWSHDIVSTLVGLSSDLKMGQYLKIPPRAMFVAQIWGTIIGAIVKYVVMISITGAQRDLLLNPTGNNIWSGRTMQSLNSNAITWSLSKELYGPSGPYFIIPIGIFIGFAATVVHWLINKRWPYIGPVRVDRIILPIIFQYSAWMHAGVNSVVSSTIIIGLVSQLWLRRYHPGWYRKYNYILGGALDGGAQVMIFILSFAVFGASGVSRPFPTWAGNPAKGNVDYCNGNGALE